MTEINAYLHFDGNAREAMIFYQECIGGSLYFQTVGETPLAVQMPAEMHKLIMHAALTKGNMAIFASDMVATGGVTQGNSISLCINCSSLAEISTYYAHLVQGGKAVHELSEAFWGSTFGDLNDKYGINWMLNFDKSVNVDK